MNTLAARQNAIHIDRTAVVTWPADPNKGGGLLRLEISEPAAGTAGPNCFGPRVSEGNVQDALDLTPKC